MDNVPKIDRLNVKEAEASLLTHYKSTKEAGFNEKAKSKARKAWYLQNIKRKQKRGEVLSSQEKNWMMTRPSAFVIKRKEFVHTAWLLGMRKASQSLEDQIGASENHTQYCKCSKCQESKARRLSV
jgi:hypothetical protein